eukprot:PhF_6_TR42357/c0_g1_i1/m.63896
MSTWKGTSFVPPGAQETDQCLHSLKAAATDHYKHHCTELPPPKSRTITLCSESFLTGPSLSAPHDTIKALHRQLIQCVEGSGSRECIVTVLFCTLCEVYNALNTLANTTAQFWGNLLVGEIILHSLVTMQADGDTVRHWLSYNDRWKAPWMALQMFRSRLLPLPILMDDLMRCGGSSTEGVLAYLLSHEDFSVCYNAQCVGQ